MGETLTAPTPEVADQKGLTGAAFSCQCLHCDGINDSDISGAANSTYTMVAANEGPSSPTPTIAHKQESSDAPPRPTSSPISFVEAAHPEGLEGCKKINIFHSLQDFITYTGWCSDRLAGHVVDTRQRHGGLH